MTKQAWVVRLGNGGVLASDCWESNCIVIGWNIVDDLSWLLKYDNETEARDALREHVRGIYKNLSPASLGNTVGQILRFVYLISKGDYILSPDSEAESIQVSRIDGDYEWNTDHKTIGYYHWRKVQWIANIDRSKFPQSVLKSLTRLTVFNINKHLDTIRSILEAEGEDDKEPSKDDFEGFKDVWGKELYIILRNRLLELHPRDFEKVVAELLGTMGLTTSLTNYVGDRGIDITGSLRIGDLAEVNQIVQVKRASNKVGREVVQKLRGTLGPGDHGAIITTGEFTKPAIEEAGMSDRLPVNLINGRQLVEMLLENFNQLSEDTQKFLQVKRRIIPLFDQFVFRYKQ